jgi:hypothetical protein
MSRNNNNVPDEANRYDGKPARSPPPEMPTDSERESATKQREKQKQFIRDVLSASSVDELTVKKHRQGNSLSINLHSLAEQQGRKDKYDSLFKHMGREPATQLIVTTAKEMNVEVTKEKKY